MYDDHAIYERIARIEERLKTLDEVRETVDRLDRDLTRYRGLVGGVLLAVTAVGTALKMYGAAIKESFLSMMP